MLKLPNTIDTIMLITQLKQIGLSENEAIIYLMLLQFPDISAGKIAKKTELPRATVYSVLDALIQKRLVASSPAGRIKYFSAEPINVLEEVVNKEYEKIKAKKNILNEILPQLTKIEQQIDKPEITYYEGKKAFQSILSKTAPRDKHIYEIGDWNTFGPFSKKFSEDRIMSNNKITLIVPDSKKARDEQKRDQVMLRKQYLINDKNFETPAIIAVNDDHVSLITMEKDNPIGIKIRNKKIIKTLQSLFYIAIKNLK